jgi:hypothetical protein
MSDYRSFALVSAALHALVQAAAADALPGATVRIGPPRGPEPGPTAISLTLYHHAANAAFRAADLPARDPGGARARRPPLAFDLHYLIAIASDQPLAGELLLGRLATAFAAQPVLARDALAGVVASGVWPALAGIVVSQQAETIRIIPAYPVPDAVAALWPGLFQLPRQPSLHLVVSPVMIAFDNAPLPPLPVRRREP